MKNDVHFKNLVGSKEYIAMKPLEQVFASLSSEMRSRITFEQMKVLKRYAEAVSNEQWVELLESNGQISPPLKLIDSEMAVLRGGFGDVLELFGTLEAWSMEGNPSPPYGD